MPDTDDSNSSISDVKSAVDHAAHKADQVGQNAHDQAVHELMSSVKSSLDSVASELKRSNDFRESEQSSIPKKEAEQPVAELVEEKAVKKVRRGARKVVKR